MKNAISEYLELSENGKKKLWENATFIFDTNVFLRLYGLTKEARDAFFNAIDKIEDRIWMPHQVAEEFMKNRVKIILDKQNEYDGLREETDNYLKKLSNAFSIDINDEECNKRREQLYNWIEQHRKTNLLVKDSSKDELLTKILNLFNNKTGKAFISDEIRKIEEDGAERYKKQIPPGYKDANKKDLDKLNNMFGDLIIWKQILLYSYQNKKDVIFVTNDKKEDWWNIIGGKTMGPRVELRKEFTNNSGKIFHMYTLEKFLEYSNETIDEKILEEVKHTPINLPEISEKEYEDASLAEKFYIKMGNPEYELEYLKRKSNMIISKCIKIGEFLEKSKHQPINYFKENELMQKQDMYVRRFLHLQNKIAELETEIKKSNSNKYDNLR